MNIHAVHWKHKGVVIMCKCGDPRCIGFYLLHPKEMGEIGNIKSKELKENPNCTFKLIDSPPSGEIYTKFMELHVLSADMAE